MATSIKERLPIAWEPADFRRVDNPDGGYIEYETEPACIFDANGDEVAYPNDNLDNSEEWCEFIVRACNSHDDLVDAIEKLLSESDPVSDNVTYVYAAEIDRLRKALAQAKGEDS